jgi:hypothetical protein
MAKIIFLENRLNVKWASCYVYRCKENFVSKKGGVISNSLIRKGLKAQMAK